MRAFCTVPYQWHAPRTQDKPCMHSHMYLPRHAHMKEGDKSTPKAKQPSVMQCYQSRDVCQYVPLFPAFMLICLTRRWDALHSVLLIFLLPWAESIHGNKKSYSGALYFLFFVVVGWQLITYISLYSYICSIKGLFLAISSCMISTGNQQNIFLSPML